MRRLDRLESVGSFLLFRIRVSCWFPCSDATFFVIFWVARREIVRLCQGRISQSYDVSALNNSDPLSIDLIGATLNQPWDFAETQDNVVNEAPQNNGTRCTQLNRVYYPAYRKVHEKSTRTVTCG
ncbi:hypothetical protein K461DRAFT_12669 [Myriangium duriaei CBS 260.36]|uniref:Uncharacterized protein n=1 Tax=Myriangium duriaei CBS 260.36 TaxID=1168546 RepID=A0A9P4JDW8_9PEZI|nr:hypothetical protein K461DRAFT_12669 [Myriangium duriaei CBS 260.36]